MKVTDTISVNPGKTTLGHSESTSNIFRSNILETTGVNQTHDLLKILFPSYSVGVNEYKKYSVPLRTLFATILIVTGIIMLEASFDIHGGGFAICSLCFGGFLALGLLTRPVMAAASVYYCIIGALMLRAGVTDMTVFTLMFGCLIFCIIGAGKYSCDTLLRHSILHHRAVSKKKRKENMMSYKAFHQVRY